MGNRKEGIEWLFKMDAFIMDIIYLNQIFFLK